MTRFFPTVQSLSVTALLIFFTCMSGCASPVALHRAVLEYDWTVNRIESELLLLNIARMRHHDPIHFTAVSSIAATFDFRLNTGLTGVLSENPGFDSLSLTLGASAAENPTVSIIPIQGEEFTRRLLTPIYDNKVEFLANQGVDPAIILRLLARGMYLEENDTRRFLLNQPHRPEEYREFRQRVLHLSSLRLTRNLFIGPIQKEEQPYSRIAVTNYDLDVLSADERQSLNEKITDQPLNYVLVDIRPGYPGGDFPLTGQIVLRSFKSILGFIARGIGEESEFHVEKDPRTGRVRVNPVKTLAIQVTETQPDELIFSVKKRGEWYLLEDQSELGIREDHWNHEAFDVLYQLYHLTVTDVSTVPTVPITIAK